ncbi:regulatory protein IE1 [Saimiriine betaherpesvirus 4]|uniref:Regulatory protein IE1 n=1 Tax=Saimiriine betaherpesvirus 4 TaxID=1535247 RepID=G8XT19_9BETA|nr:regulatory protein IE1 [Saimiriine betaherpesvirus 4]AEV80965.1 regulatory protein IE1 [Saimiriine betaherpesvirus 4]
MAANPPPKRPHDDDDPGEGTSSGPSPPKQPKIFQPEDPVTIARRFIQKTLNEEVKTQLSLGDPLFPVADNTDDDPFKECLEQLKLQLHISRQELGEQNISRYNESKRVIIKNADDIWDALKKGMKLVNETVEQLSAEPDNLTRMCYLLKDRYVITPGMQEIWESFLAQTCNVAGLHMERCIKAAKIKVQQLVEGPEDKCKFVFLKHIEMMMKTLCMPRITETQSQAVSLLTNSEYLPKDLVTENAKILIETLKSEQETIFPQLDAVAVKVTDETAKNVNDESKVILDSLLMKAYDIITQSQEMLKTLCLYILEETVKVINAKQNNFNLDQELIDMETKLRRISNSCLAAITCGVIHHRRRPDVDTYRVIAGDVETPVRMETVVVHGAGESDDEEEVKREEELKSETPESPEEKTLEEKKEPEDEGKPRNIHPMVTRSKQC